MEVIHIPSLVFSLLCAFPLVAYGGGEESKPNTAASIVMNPNQIQFESSKTKSVAITASDADVAPTLSLRDLPASVKTAFFTYSKTLTLTANNVSTAESTSFSIVATEVSAAMLQTTAQVNVMIYPKLELSELINNSERVRSMTVAYAKPLQLRIVDETNQDIRFTTCDDIPSSSCCHFACYSHAFYSVARIGMAAAREFGFNMNTSAFDSVFPKLTNDFV